MRMQGAGAHRRAQICRGYSDHKSGAPCRIDRTNAALLRTRFPFCHQGPVGMEFAGRGNALESSLGLAGEKSTRARKLNCRNPLCARLLACRQASAFVVPAEIASVALRPVSGFGVRSIAHNRGRNCPGQNESKNSTDRSGLEDRLLTFFARQLPLSIARQTSNQGVDWEQCRCSPGCWQRCHWNRDARAGLRW
jgi:hypothetical protein